MKKPYKRADDLCPEPVEVPPLPTTSHAPPIFPSTVYRCDDPQQALEMLSGEVAGYVYSRDGHPNAEMLSEKCRRLHGAQRAAVTSSGMAAMSLSLFSLLEAGDHVVFSNQLYGRSLQLLGQEIPRVGITSTAVDTCDLDATADAVRDETKLIVVEIITNPMLRVSDIAALAEIAHSRGTRLLVDNTFASPGIFRPIEHGADLVLESVTKIMNGHSDVLLGLLCGPDEAWSRVPTVLSAWGFTAAPLDCWLALRGLGTMHLRVERSSANAQKAAEFLAESEQVQAIHYPGLTGHPDHALAMRQFGDRHGSMVAFDLAGGRAAAERFIKAAEQIPFCPSLGELSTTLTHPTTTSHRGMSAAERDALGISEGTIRLSVGVESPEQVLSALEEGLRGV